MNLEDKKFIYDFIRRQKIAVLATVNQSRQPEAAVVEFGETEDLEIIFDTLTAPGYRKYKNLQKNQAVAFVIGWEDNITVQYEGMAKELKGEDRDKYKQIFFQKNPEAEKWDSNPEIKYFLVLPKWVRYSDYDGKPYKVIELKF
jgi:nitroimidazol reductase NimA-like FMN-containing flavoprotein (pyridoxamine 5'-phosphate oxidase superfamily)